MPYPLAFWLRRRRGAQAPTIQRYLDITTAAVPQRTMEALSNDAIEYVVSYPNEYGAFVPVTSDTREGETREDVAAEHPELVAIFDWCTAHNVRLIRFDCDGGDVPAGLPTFEW
jgi:hypothetical protein